MTTDTMHVDETSILAATVDLLHSIGEERLRAAHPDAKWVPDYEGRKQLEENAKRILRLFRPYLHTTQLAEQRQELLEALERMVSVYGKPDGPATIEARAVIRKARSEPDLAA